jgi:hypothetical protein
MMLGKDGLPAQPFPKGRPGKGGLSSFSGLRVPVSLSTGEIEQLIRNHAETRGVTTAKTHSIIPLCFLLSPDVPPPADAQLRVRWMLGVARRLGLTPWPEDALNNTPSNQAGFLNKTPKTNFYHTRAWRLLRYRTLLKYGAKCMCCGATARSSGEPLHVDHIKPRSKHPKLALNENNVAVLCAPCNTAKGAWDSTDWRSSVAHLHASLEPDSPDQKYL